MKIMKIAIYDKNTGLIKRTIECSPNYVSSQCKENEEFFLNCPENITHILDNKPVFIETLQSDADLIFSIRNQRTRMLQACDWTQTPDNPLPEEEKARYRRFRQALRDFPQTCNIYNPIWPKLEDF